MEESSTMLESGINPPSRFPLHELLQGFSSTCGSAPLGENRLKTPKHAKTLTGTPPPPINLTVAVWRS
eukprot:7149797-Pyramimonas_sp.AAC.1